MQGLDTRLQDTRLPIVSERRAVSRVVCCVVNVRLGPSEGVQEGGL